LREKSQLRYREYLETLRRDIPVEIYGDRLSFRYVKKGQP